MSKTLTAFFKVSLKQTFDFRGKNNKKNISFFVPILLIAIFGCFLSSVYSLLLSFMAKEAQMDLRYVVYAMAGFSSMLALTTSILKVKNTLFGGNDYDMLASLPISKRTIISVKFFSLYLIELLYSFILIIPSTCIVLIFGCTPLILLDAVVLFFLSPVLPLLLAGILGIAIGFISDRFRFGNILTTLFYLVFLGVIMYSSILLNSGNEEQSLENVSKMLTIFGWFNPTTMFLKLNLPILTYVIYVAVNLGILLVMIVLFGGCYDYFHLLLTTTKVHRKYIAKEVQRKGEFKALFHMDLKRYFTSKSYLINTITGGILCVVVTGIMIISFTSLDDPEAKVILKEMAPYFSLIIPWCVGIAVPSAVAINFEGKCFWQIKSLPISYKRYSYSKILLSEIVLAPFVLIASIVLICFAEINFMNVFTILVLPQIYLVAMNFIAYFINMYCYKLNWSNEMEAVKNSRGMIYAMLIDFAFTGLTCAVLLGVGLLVKFWIGAVLAIGFTAGIAIAAYLLVKKNCEAALCNIEV